MPLSLLLNDGANKKFRTYSIDEVNYSLDKVFDFNDEDVFNGVATRYCLAKFSRDKKTTFPVPYFRSQESKWEEFAAKPMFHLTDPLSIVNKTDILSQDSFSPIFIKKESDPRQGVNTCGANEVFFFDNLKERSGDLVELSNKQFSGIILPRQFVYPLICNKDFKMDGLQPSKWVLLPYNRNGRPLEAEYIKSFPTLENYLNERKDILKSRKGVMLNATIKRGYWWALLGVGEYSFFPFKIVWEAYGKTTFKPKIFSGEWQANQSLQAFIPVRTMEEAERVFTGLSHKSVEDYLLSLKMEGTMNWAQPGKIKKFMKYDEQPLSLF